MPNEEPEVTRGRPLVEMRDIHKSFGGIHAVEGSRSRSWPARWWGSWATTGPASRPSSRSCPAPIRWTTGRSTSTGNGSASATPATPSATASRPSTRISRCTTTWTRWRTSSSVARSTPGSEPSTTPRWSVRPARSSTGSIRASCPCAIRCSAFPEASASPSRLPARCISTPGSSSWTSRPRPSDSARRGRSRSLSSGSSRRGSACSSSATTSTTCSTCPIASP